MQIAANVMELVACGLIESLIELVSRGSRLGEDMPRFFQPMFVQKLLTLMLHESVIEFAVRVPFLSG